MSILLPALDVAFAAFCVWLGVRIVNRRERWAKWTAMGLIGVTTGYLVGITFLIWADYNLPLPKGRLHDVGFAYAAPWRFVHQHAPEVVALAMHSYIDWVAQIGK